MEQKIGGNYAEERYAKLHIITTQNELFAIDTPILLEVIPEKIALKKAVFAETCPQLPPDTVIWTNTSCLNVEDMAMASRRPNMFLGTHGMNPVNLTPTVEVVKHDLLDQDVLRWTLDVLRKIGKKPFVALNVPGFIVNKLFMRFAFHGLRILERREADVATLDQALTMSLGHPQGLCLLLDRIGMDVMRDVGEALYSATQDHDYCPPALVYNMIKAGNLGAKTGKGFYDWRDDPKNHMPVVFEELTVKM